MEQQPADERRTEDDGSIVDNRISDADGSITPPEVPLRTITLVKWGLVAWAVVLVVMLAIPALRTGDRDWWIWVPVAAILLGGLGYVYLRRGRGNASMA
ncbi:DUF2530 domain-containing protein [Ornithinimicrobium panacihumi]|uniref:DUF2530 domain-containing protein n=1 Tax=Ornithinimicrobium panacihumi TaxID=2008449 RepID=UPI003F8907B9